ncbi:cadherin-like domain-containing protein [Neptuniibacter caesariensis]|uniref:Lipoprotein receptor-related protein n=1 Tax=Neptuniibacter caesariensis TaxID=207954 RepID=A0A7U8C6E5_NEPCE|nr:cadherin-like domain-containing protein [Neptuniibacter caesariensis]EAR61561.1 lipoprotein receptor-related protein [Oceanospirillum sp. MED92] [Neptuniibacter caesariensis]
MLRSTKSKKAQVQQQESYFFEQLEPRVMLSADPLGAAEGLVDTEREDDSDLLKTGAEYVNLDQLDALPIPVILDTEELGSLDALQPLSDGTDNSLEIVVIDSSVKDAQTLLTQLQTDNPDADLQIHFIDAESDPFSQITDLLSQHENVSALHLFSHAEDGILQLGGQNIGANELGQYADQLTQWQDSMLEGGDLLLYGCNLAETESGVSFIQSLASLTNLDLAASTDLSGNKNFGGDWDLEYQTGDVSQFLSFNQGAWKGILATFNVTIFTDVVNPGDGETSLREAIIDANANGETDTINLGVGTYTLNKLTGGADEQRLDLDIYEGIHIVGAGADQTSISAGDIFNIFEFHAGSGASSISSLSLVDGNGTATSQAGAIQMADAGGSLTLTDVEIFSSITATNGGGIYNLGTLNLERVTIAENSAQLGGGIYNDTGATMTLINVTISGNSASSDGGGVYNKGDADLTNVTIAKNDASNAAGGFFRSAGTVNLSNTVIADNTSGTSSIDVAGDFTSDGSNFIGDKTGGNGFGADLSGIASLDTLADYGGQTRTHAILAGSALIDAGTDTGAPTEDQREITRVGTTDIGAYEFIPNQEPTLSATAENPTFTEGGSAAVAFSAANASTVEGTQSFIALTLSITNITDGSNEVLNISSVAIALAHLNTGSVSGFTYNVSLVGSTATIALTGGSANNAAMNGIINSISYQNNSQDPTAATRRLSIESVQDDGGTADGGDDSLSSALFSDIDVLGVNDEPTLSLTGGSTTFTEGGTAASIFSGSSADTIESSQTFSELTLTVSNLSDGTNEVLNIDGSSIALVNGSGTSATNSLSYTVSLSAGTGTLTFTGGSVSAANLDTLLNGISYQNNSQDPTAGNRVVTLTSLQDSGGTANSGVNTITPNTATTVNVQADNDIPVLGNNSLTLSQGATVTLDSSILSASDVDNTDSALTFTVSNINNGYFAFTADTTTAITSFTQAQVTASQVVFIHDGGELTPAYDVSVSDGSLSTVATAASVAFTGTSDGVVWLSTDGDEGTGNGITGLNGTAIDKGDLLQQAGPNYSMGGGSTDGTFSVAFDISNFSTGDGTNGIHYVTSSVTIGATNPINLQAGDIILSSKDNMTLVSNGAGAPADLNITQSDLFYFRPDVAGDYSTGNFYMLLSDPFNDGAEITGLTLVEKDTWVADYQLNQGDLLLAHDDGGEKNDIWLLKTDTLDTANSGTFPAALKFIEGDDENINISKKIYGIDLLESDQTIGGVTYDAGTLFVTLDSDNDDAGRNERMIRKEDIAALELSKTTLGGTEASARVTILFDGSSANFDSGNEALDAFSFTFDPDTVDDPPVLATNSFTLNEGATTTITPTFLNATDVDSPDAGLTYAISSLVGGEFQLTSNLGVAVTSFTQGQINNSEVIFIDDGDEIAPSFSISVSDDTSTTAVVPASITFVSVNDAPTLSLTGDSPTFTEGGSAVGVYSSATANTIESGQTFSALTFTVSNLSDGNSEVLNVNGSALALVNGSGSTTNFSYSVSLSSGTATITLTGGSLNAASLEALLEGVTYQNNSQDPTAGNRVVTLTSLQDSGGTANSGVDTLNPNVTSTVTVQAVNDAPTLSLTGDSPTFTEGGSAVGVYSSATANTIESGQTFSALTFTVSNLSDGNSEVLNVNGSALALVNGSGSTTNFSYNVSLSSGTATITLTGGSLNAASLEALLEGVTYQNNSQDPTAGNRVVTLTSLQDSGGTANSGVDTSTPNVTSTVTVQAVNDAPTLSLTGGSTTFTEGGAAASIFSGSSANTIESGQTFSALTLTVSNLSDGTNEVLNIDGSTIALTNGSGTTATNSLSYTVSVSAGTATLTFTGGSVSAGNLDTLLNGISYQNNSQDPTAGNRVVTLTSLQDSGGTANSGVDTITPNTATTVTVQSVNDAPTLSLTGGSTTFTEGGAAASVFSGSSAATIEAGQTFSALTLTVSNLSDGTNEVLNIDGSTIALVNGSGTSATNSLSYTVSLSAGTATLTFTGGSVSSANLDTLLNGISYQNNSQDPTTGNRTVTLTSLQDSGGTANSGVDTITPNTATTVTVQSVNDAPTLSLTGGSTTFTEGGVAASIFSGSSADTIESGQTFSSLTLTVSNLSDGTNEVLNIDGSTIALVNGSGTSATNSLSYTVSLSAGTATLTFTGGSVSAGNLDTLLNGISYQNNSQDPTAGNRIVTLTSLQDSGGTANSGVDTLNPNVTSTVTVQAVNDPPSFVNNSFTIDQGQRLTLSLSNLSASDIDNLDTGLIFTVSSVSGGQFENNGAVGTAITSFTLGDIGTGSIDFVDNNDATAPAFSFTVGDGALSAGPVAGSIAFTAAPVVEEVVEEPVEVVEEPDAGPEVELAPEEIEEEAPVEEIVEPVEIVFEETTEPEVQPSPQPEEPRAVSDARFSIELPETDVNKVKLAVAEAVSAVSELRVGWGDLSDPLLLVKSSQFMGSLDALDQDIQKNITLDAMTVGTGAALSTGLSIGYVAWLLRSGIILTSVLTSLPAWRFIDPLPVLSRLGDEVEDEESLEDMVSDNKTPDSEETKA